MDVQTQYIDLSTQGHTEILDITGQVDAALRSTGMKEGQVTVFAKGSTTGITTLEYEPGLVHTDLAAMMDQFAPYGVPYEHNKTWGDDNGASHLRSALTGTSYVVPFVEGNLILGTWQQIVFIDYDTRSRNRRVIVQIWGK